MRSAMLPLVSVGGRSPLNTTRYCKAYSLKIEWSPNYQNRQFIRIRSRLMSLNRIIFWTIHAVTGRNVTVNTNVPAHIFLGYLLQQFCYLARGVCAQLISGRKPKLLFIAGKAKIKGLGLLQYGPRL